MAVRGVIHVGPRGLGSYPAALYYFAFVSISQRTIRKATETPTLSVFCISMRTIIDFPCGSGRYRACAQYVGVKVMSRVYILSYSQSRRAALLCLDSFPSHERVLFSRTALCVSLVKLKTYKNINLITCATLGTSPEKCVYIT